MTYYYWDSRTGIF